MASAVRASIGARSSLGWVRPPPASSGAQPPLPHASSASGVRFQTPSGKIVLARTTPTLASGDAFCRRGPRAARRGACVAAAASSYDGGAAAADVLSIGDAASEKKFDNETSAPSTSIVGPPKRRRGRPKAGCVADITRHIMRCHAFRFNRPDPAVIARQRHRMPLNSRNEGTKALDEVNKYLPGPIPRARASPARWTPRACPATPRASRRCCGGWRRRQGLPLVHLSA